MVQRSATRAHIKTCKGEKVDFGGICGLFRVVMGAAGVPDASPGPLGHEGGSMMWKRGYDGKFLAAMTDFNCIKQC